MRGRDIGGRSMNGQGMGGRGGLRTYLAGAAVARTGDEMSGPALLLAGLAATGSAASASALLAALTAAAAIGGPAVGALLDRTTRPGRLLAVALGGYAVGLLAVDRCLGRLPLAFTVLAALLTGLAGPALSGGWTSRLTCVVRPEGLARANALDAMTFNLASLAGPALAGLVATAVGAPFAVAAAAVLIALAVPAALGLPAASPYPGGSRPAARRARRTGVGRRRRALRAARSAVACVSGTPELARATAVSVVSCAGQGVFVACVPLLGARALGGAGRGALLLSGVAATAAVANAVLPRPAGRVAPDTIVWCGAAAQAAGCAVAALGPPRAWPAVVVLVGAGEGPQLTALFAVRHREAPGRLRARVFTTGASLKITAFACGAAAAGPVAARTASDALLLAASLQALACALFAALTPSCRGLPAADRPVSGRAARGDGPRRASPPTSAAADVAPARPKRARGGRRSR